MNLKQIVIKNYRSIESVEFNIEPVNGSFTYTLLGINESGKSSFLKAVSLLQSSEISYPEDYFDDSEPVELSLNYELTSDEIKELNEKLVLFDVDKIFIKRINLKNVTCKVTFSPDPTPVKEKTEILDVENFIIPEYTYVEGETTIRKKDAETEDEEDFSSFDFLHYQLENHFWNLSHQVIFWKSSPQYLILDEIDLDAFSVDPKKISIPLYNCFKIAEIKNLRAAISKLKSPVEIQNLEDLLSDKVSEHINLVWPEHPIKIRFKINNSNLTFLIEDNDVKYRMKTTGQRSDGFRQFVSFLLTLSAQNQTGELANSIFLLDEPETHLHPTAQLNLNDELIKIPRNKNNNLVIFATHSNYMIDKNNIDRCFKITKDTNKTKMEKIKRIQTSYSEVNYEIFNIPTTDYHNELYGYLEDEDRNKLSSLEKNKRWFNEKFQKTEEVSLSTYIRHSIHHPENKSNKMFTDSELLKSIKLLRGLRDKSKSLEASSE